jgi:hypothetical protein
MTDTEGWCVCPHCKNRFAASFATSEDADGEVVQCPWCKGMVRMRALSESQQEQLQWIQLKAYYEAGFIVLGIVALIGLLAFLATL